MISPSVNWRSIGRQASTASPAFTQAYTLERAKASLICQSILKDYGLVLILFPVGLVQPLISAIQRELVD